MRLEIYVPYGGPLAETERRMCAVFGGVTTIDGYGSWMNAKQEVVSEPVHIVYSFADERKWLPHVVHQTGKDIAGLVKVALDEETVLYTIDGEGVFV